MYGVRHGRCQRQAELARRRAQARARDRLAARECRHERRVLRRDGEAEPRAQAVLREVRGRPGGMAAPLQPAGRNRRSTPAGTAFEGRARARGAHASPRGPGSGEGGCPGRRPSQSRGHARVRRRRAPTPTSRRRVSDIARRPTLSTRPRARAHAPADAKRHQARRRIERAEGRSNSQGRRLAPRPRRALALSRWRRPVRATPS